MVKMVHSEMALEFRNVTVLRQCSPSGNHVLEVFLPYSGGC